MIVIVIVIVIAIVIVIVVIVVVVVVVVVVVIVIVIVLGSNKMFRRCGAPARRPPRGRCPRRGRAYDTLCYADVPCI